MVGLLILIGAVVLVFQAFIEGKGAAVPDTKKEPGKKKAS